MTDRSLIGNYELMRRPRYSDDFVRRRAAEIALPRVKEWIGVCHLTDAEIIRDLMRGLNTSSGYENAKSLEAIGWSADSHLVEILADGDFLRDARLEHVKQWVKCLGIELAIPLEAQVVYRGRCGKVIGHDTESASYLVRTPDLPGNQWIVCDAEEVSEQAVIETPRCRDGA